MFCDDHVGERIKNCRASLDLSQAELAVMADIAPAQLYRYESGRTKPRPQIAGRLALALNVSAAWLANGALPMEREYDKDVPARPGTEQFELQLPPDLEEHLREQATKNGLTIEMQILMLLKDSVDLERERQPSDSPPPAPAPATPGRRTPLSKKP